MNNTFNQLAIITEDILCRNVDKTSGSNQSVLFSKIVSESTDDDR